MRSPRILLHPIAQDVDFPGTVALSASDARGRLEAAMDVLMQLP